MDAQEKKKYKQRLLIGAILYMAIFLTLVLVINLKEVNRWIGSVLLLLRPVLIGLGLAYLCNPLFRFIERKVLSRIRPQSLRRAVSLTLTYLTVLLILVLILLLIIPRLIDSIISFATNYNSHISSAIGQINAMFASINSMMESLTGNETFLEYLNEEEIRHQAADLFQNLDKTSQMVMDYLSGLDITPMRNALSDAISIVTDSVLGIFVSIYLLSTKEKRAAQIMKMRRALFNDETNERLTKMIKTADRSFGGFLEGKLLDSVIIAILTYVVISLFGIPYADLIAVFIGIMNIIPVIGLLIGAIPTSLILLLTDPGKLIPFLIIILVIQQIDSNILSPKILGSNTGVSSLCVMIAVTTMGTLWGFVGMILGVPLFATVLEVTDEIVTTRLQRKGLPSGLANYYANDAVVDPIKNAHITADKTVQKFEKEALRVRRMKENGDPLNRKQRLILVIYRMAHKYRILSEMTDETHARFSAEDAAKNAAERAEQLLQQRRADVEDPADDVSEPQA